ncbi:MAG: hypothetical protein ABH865_02920 [Candidatus Omnitrophota bacterium]
MKRWYLFVIVAYGICVSFVIFCANFFAFAPHASMLSFLADWRDSFSDNVLIYGGFLILIMLMQAGFLLIPVRLTRTRPVEKRNIIVSLAASGLAAGLLVMGSVFAIGEAITAAQGSNAIPWIAWIGLFLMWVIWAVIFYHQSTKLEPGTLIRRKSRWLLRGSILELLIVIPTHILARSRDYCCAGFGTFLGITFGIAVLLFSFGPGVFFLYARRYQEKKGKLSTSP